MLIQSSRRFITQEGFKLEKTKPTVPPAITGVVSWRAEGIKYRKNEVFLDVVESINLMVCIILNLDLLTFFHFSLIFS